MGANEGPVIVIELACQIYQPTPEDPLEKNLYLI